MLDYSALNNRNRMPKMYRYSTFLLDHSKEFSRVVSDTAEALTELLLSWLIASLKEIRGSSKNAKKWIMYLSITFKRAEYRGVVTTAPTHIFRSCFTEFSTPSNKSIALPMYLNHLSAKATFRIIFSGCFPITRPTAFLPRPSTPSNHQDKI